MLKPGAWCLAVTVLVILTGCRGLTSGEMAAVQTHSDDPRVGNVYLIRGWIGVFSTGIDDLSEKISAAGVRTSVFQDLQHGQLGNEIARKYKDSAGAEPLILIGHSYGADDVVRVARTLNDAGVKVDLLVTLDATTPPKVPPNVALCYNYFQPQATDFIPLFRGIPLEQEKQGEGELVNVDLRRDRKDLLESNTNHINIDKNPRLHTEVLKHVLEACPDRAVWAARQPANDVRQTQSFGESAGKTAGPRG